MSRPIFPNSVAIKPSGELWGGAKFSLLLLTDTAVRSHSAHPHKPIFVMETNEDGTFPIGLTIETPESGAWQWRLYWPDGQYADAYIEQGDGSAIEIDDFVTLAGQAGSEAGTPAAEFLNELYTAVSEADDTLLLETASGDLALTNAPRGYWMQAEAIPAGETVTIPSGYQMIVFGGVTIPAGAALVIEANGRLVTPSI